MYVCSKIQHSTAQHSIARYSKAKHITLICLSTSLSYLRVLVLVYTSVSASTSCNTILYPTTLHCTLLSPTTPSYPTHQPNQLPSYLAICRGLESTSVSAGLHLYLPPTPSISLHLPPPPSTSIHHYLTARPRHARTCHTTSYDT
jgi:hypothetical protein